MKKGSLKKKKINQREVTQKLTNCLNLIHIAVKFHQDIQYGYLVMTHIRKVWKKNNNKKQTNK